MRVAVVGSRSIVSEKYVFAVLDRLIGNLKLCGPSGLELVSGGAAGVDSLAERYAQRIMVPIKVFKPDWQKFGHRAGYVRNREIVDYCDRMIAIWDGESRGTNHSIDLCREEGKPVEVIVTTKPRPEDSKETAEAKKPKQAELFGTAEVPTSRKQPRPRMPFRVPAMEEHVIRCILEGKVGVPAPPAPCQWHIYDGDHPCIVTKTVGRLVKDGLVLADNPLAEASPKITLTEAGRRYAEKHLVQ